MKGNSRSLKTKQFISKRKPSIFKEKKRNASGKA